MKDFLWVWIRVIAMFGLIFLAGVISVAALYVAHLLAGDTGLVVLLFLAVTAFIAAVANTE